MAPRRRAPGAPELPSTARPRPHPRRSNRRGRAPLRFGPTWRATRLRLGLRGTTTWGARGPVRVADRGRGATRGDARVRGRRGPRIALLGRGASRRAALRRNRANGREPEAFTQLRKLSAGDEQSPLSARPCELLIPRARRADGLDETQRQAIDHLFRREAAHVPPARRGALEPRELSLPLRLIADERRVVARGFVALSEVASGVAEGP